MKNVARSAVAFWSFFRLLCVTRFPPRGPKIDLFFGKVKLKLFFWCQSGFQNCQNGFQNCSGAIRASRVLAELTDSQTRNFWGRELTISRIQRSESRISELKKISNSTNAALQNRIRRTPGDDLLSRRSQDVWASSKEETGREKFRSWRLPTRRPWPHQKARAFQNRIFYTRV